MHKWRLPAARGARSGQESAFNEEEKNWLASCMRVDNGPESISGEVDPWA
jgi:hypothetical protein